MLVRKEDVRAIFERYGDVIGVSTHRGYAFVQYSDETAARNAVAAEDQRIYAGQEIGKGRIPRHRPDRHPREEIARVARRMYRRVGRVGVGYGLKAAREYFDVAFLAQLKSFLYSCWRGGVIV